MYLLRCVMNSSDGNSSDGLKKIQVEGDFKVPIDVNNNYTTFFSGTILMSITREEL